MFEFSKRVFNGTCSRSQVIPPHNLGSSAHPIATRAVTNVDEFIKWTKTVTRNFGLGITTLLPWYRRHNKESYRLKPSFYRCEIDQDKERELIRDFKICALDNPPPMTRSPTDWLFIAQHYDIPTRLLDWSEKPLVSLFFSKRAIYFTQQRKGAGVNWLPFPALWYCEAYPRKSWF